MGLLDRWDRHNQAVMDRDRTRDLSEWTIGAVLLIAFNLVWIVGDLPRLVAFGAQVLIVAVAIVGVIRIVRRRREQTSRDALEQVDVAAPAAVHSRRASGSSRSDPG